MSLEPEFELQVPDSVTAGSNMIPLYSSETFRRLPPERRSIFSEPARSVDQRNQIQRSGYQVQQNMDYLSGRLKDGRSFVVPVRTINLSPGQ